MALLDFIRGDRCYIIDDKQEIKSAKIIKRQGNYYTVQLVGSCGALQLSANQIFHTPQDAANSIGIEISKRG